MVKQKKIRLKDVAYALNTSVTCVSRALRDCNDISEDMKKAVRAKALELGYHSKYNELKTKEKYVVALIVDSLKNPYFIKLGDILFSKFSKEQCDFLVMIADTFGKVNDTLIKKCIYRNADVILSFNEFDEKSVEISRLNNIPLIMLGRIPKDDYVDAVYTNDELGGKLAFNKLRDMGATRFLYLEENRSEASIRRLSGFTSRIKENNVSEFYIADANNLEEAYSIIKTNNIDGIFAYNDLTAAKIMNLLKDHDGVNNIKVVGYDNDMEYLKDIYPRFDSIDFDYELIGNKVIEIIESKLIKKEREKRYLIELDVK